MYITIMISMTYTSYYNTNLYLAILNPTYIYMFVNTQSIVVSCFVVATLANEDCNPNCCKSAYKSSVAGRRHLLK